MTMPATSAFRNILKYSHGGLLISAGILLALQGILIGKYYSDMFPPETWNTVWRSALAAVSSTGLKMLAFFLLFMTVRDFSEGRSTVGKWGLLVTIILNGYFLYESHCMAALWSGNSASYWHLLPFLAVITIMVLFIEWRLAISVNTATKEENALALAAEQAETDRKTILDLTGKLNRYEAEKQETENRKREAAEAEARDAQQRREQEIEEMFAENDRLRKKLQQQEKKTGGIEGVISPEAVLRVAKDFMRKNPRVRPTQTIIAQLMNKTERTIRGAFPNGSWDAEIENLFREINTLQPETA